MNKKRAFTLIELLVVIAIIAILAAILFPVFAQAKLSAKKSASLSNIKQITLANIMYENDYDDNFVLFSQNPFNTACGQIAPNGVPYATGTGDCLAPPYNVTYNWPTLLQPYTKSLGIYVDPATGDPQNYFGGGPNANTFHQGWRTQYGYNYLFLAPITIGGLSSGGWLPNGFYSGVGAAGRSSTTAINPAGTVMFTGSVGTPVVGGTTLVAGAQYSTPDNSFLTDPGTGCQLYWATNRLTYVNVGQSTSPAASSKWGSQWVKNTPVGEITGITRALNPYQGANVGWVDGHAKSMTADGLAAGTDFGTSGTATGYAGFGSVITDITKYLWTLDGTTKDAGTGTAGPCKNPIG